MEFQEVLTKGRELLDVELFTVQSDPITIGSILVFLLFLIGFLTLGSITRRVLQNKFLKQFDIDSGLQLTLARVAQYIIVIIGVMISFQFLENDVVNFSHGDPTFRLDIEVGVSYSSDLDTVLKALNEIAEEHPKVMKLPKHQVHLTNFGDSSWNMQLRVWIPNVKERYILRNEMNQAIVRKFKEHKIEIPFPQRDLHLRTSIAHPKEKSATDRSTDEK